ncbi:MAG: CHASE2 domain-containing protein [Allosphingosinicella sp.]|uniref:CHASE2 domain-containing protein n=1 Tax=Allosphingosinicella sp. TaxID=2823234 RepID=UPI00395F5FF0
MADAGTRVADKEQRRGLIGVRRTLRQIGVARLLLTLLLLGAAVAVARYSWTMPLVSDAERGLYDLRFYWGADRLGQDDRITLVTYTDQTLEQLGKRSPLDRRMMAQALRAIDAMNPRAIGIDILIDQEQPEDAELIATMRAMRTPTFLAFTTNQSNPEQMQYWQEQFLRNFLNQVRTGPVRPASIQFLPDPADGVMRRWPEPDPALPTFLASAMAPEHPAFRGYRGAIDYRLTDSPEIQPFTELPVEMLASLASGEMPPEESAAIAESLRPTIEGRYILLGGNIQLLDDFETPMSRAAQESQIFTKGMIIHAHMLSQLLDDRMPWPIPNWLLWAAAILVVAGGVLTAVLEGRGWILGVAVMVQVGLIAVLPFLLEAKDVETIHLPAAGWGAGWLLAVLGAGIAARAVGSEQRKFASSALGKYLPADVAAQIMRDPDRLALKGEKKKIYALFTDLEGFTKLSHGIQPEQLSILLNRYLDMLSDTVLKHGGTIDKFVGDAVVAFWGAPISRPDDAERAVKAAVAMFEAGEEFRRSADADLPTIGRTRVGLHHGEAVVGNFGGQKRIQYTALGDGMNTAARLESANKALQTGILVSTAVKEQTDVDLYRPMGRVVLSGRATPIEIWEPALHMDGKLRGRLRELWQRYDGGDRDALGEIERVAAAHPDDAALHNFVFRIREAGPGGAFVLESK